MNITDTVIQLTPAEIADKTDRRTLLAAIASVAAQETVTPPPNNWVSWDVHGVVFDVVQELFSGYYGLSTRTYHLLGVQVKVECHYRTVHQRRVMLKTGTLDIAKLRAAYAECRAKASEVAIKDAEIDEATAKRHAEIAEAARRAALYPDLLAALTNLCAIADAIREEHRQPDPLCPLCDAAIQARAVIARCGGAK